MLDYYAEMQLILCKDNKQKYQEQERWRNSYNQKNGITFLCDAVL